jgi:C-terminal processing protease CtpA/Prc
MLTRNPQNSAGRQICRVTVSDRLWLLCVISSCFAFSSQATGQAGPEQEVNPPRIFTQVFVTISSRYVDIYADSVLWKLALNGLLEGLEDPFTSLERYVEAPSSDATSTWEFWAGRVGACYAVALPRGSALSVPDADSAMYRAKSGVLFELSSATADSASWPGQFLGEAMSLRVPASIEFGDGNLAYVDIDRFEPGLTGYVADRFRRDGGVAGVLIDLRDNPGGSLSEAESLLELFLPVGGVIAVRESRGEVQVRRARYPPLTDVPTVVLVNRRTSSAAEIFADAMAANERATVLGEATFGKGTIQHTVAFGDGWALRYTTARSHKVSTLGESLNKTRRQPSATAFQVRPDQTLAYDDLVTWEHARRKSSTRSHYALKLLIRAHVNARYFPECGVSGDLRPSEIITEAQRSGEWPTGIEADSVTISWLDWRIRLGAATGQHYLCELGSGDRAFRRAAQLLATKIRLEPHCFDDGSE